MSGGDLLALLPWSTVAAGAGLVLLAIAIRRGHGLVAWLTTGVLAVAAASLPLAAGAAPRRVTLLLVVDGYALFFSALLLAASAAVVWLAHDDLERHTEEREEFYALLLLATLGAMVLVASRHLATLLLGLELLSVCLYVMAAYLRERRAPLEAGMKYLVLTGVASAFLVFGMALLYAGLGTLEVEGASVLLERAGAQQGAIVLAGLALVLVGAGFKLALVPFHLWAPDVYEGAPTPAAAYLATVSKAAMLALVVRYVVEWGDYGAAALRAAIAVLAVASMLAGNLLALLQTRVKRILAYSSIAHLGYVLVALLAGGSLGVEAAAFYLTVYAVTVLAAFGVVAVLAPETGEAPRIEDYRALAWRRPLLACVMTAALLSLAGIPLTAGFMGKLTLVAAGLDRSLAGPVLVLVAGSAIGIFYYLRVVVAIFAGPEPQPAAPTRIPVASGLVLGALTVLLLGLGIYPGPLLRLIQTTVASGGW